MKNFSRLLIVFCSMAFITAYGASAKMAGSGALADPYQIATCQDLQNMSQNMTASYALINNVDCSATKTWNGGAGFAPIGSDNNTFDGTLNGNNYNISNLYINRPTTNQVSLFGNTGGSSVVSFVILSNVNITGQDFVGGLIGLHTNGIVAYDSVSGNVTSTSQAVGGLVGQNDDKISTSYSSAVVSGSNYVGGLVGSSYGTISDSYATGAVTGNAYIGGFIGSNQQGNISNGYSIGKVSGKSNNVGGFSGLNTGVINNSYWNTQTSGLSSSYGGTGATTAQMQNSSTFSGWDFTNTWRLDATVSYPQLRWLYQIANCTDLQNMSQSPGSNFQLMTDINCADTQNWNGGAGFLPISNFTGNFDGGGHSIYNVYINQPNGTAVGVFATSSGVIANVNFADENISSNAPNASTLGGVVANNSGTITNVSAQGTYTGGSTGTIDTGSSVGAIAGYNTGKIANSQGHGNVQGSFFVGGLVGYSVTAGAISNCFSDATVMGGNKALGVEGGGLVGVNDGVLQLSYATGNVTGFINAGGLLGWNQGDGSVVNSYSEASVYGSIAGGLASVNDGAISNDYSTGQVNATSVGGGLLAKLNGGSVSSSYYNTDTSGQNDTGKGTPRTTSQMFLEPSYIGWDFTNSWKMQEGRDYARLIWQTVPLNMVVMPITSPQQINQAFVVDVRANNGPASANTTVYLFSTRGPVSPSYVTLDRSGEWMGYATVYAPGKNDALLLSWQDPISQEEQYGQSIEFDVTNASGQIPQDATVSGTVVDNDQGNSVPGATVTLYSADPEDYINSTPPLYCPQVQCTATTDTNGNFTLKGIPAGNAYLDVSMSGVEDYIQPISLASGRPVTTQVTLVTTCSAADLAGVKVPVLLVPGIMGSKSSGWIYPSLPAKPPKWDSNVLTFHDPNSAVGWGSLRDQLEANGYKAGCTMFDVPYDWSISLPSARDKYLIPWINKAKSKSGATKVDIIAHSMGGLITRSYIQSPSYNNDVRKFAMVGTPNLGSDKVYYTVEGGDPITSDTIVGDSSLYFYTNTLDYLYEGKNTDKHLCKFGWGWNAFTPTKCNNNKVYSFLHMRAPSPGQLMPVYQDALQTAMGNPAPIKSKEENTFLEALDGIPCLNPKGCVDPAGNLYQFNTPLSVLTPDSSGVQTMFFPGTGQDTVNIIRVGAPSAQYLDGVPQGSPAISTQGDGTVLQSSMAFTNSLPIANPIQNHEHSALIGWYANQLAYFIVVNPLSAPPLRDASPTTMLVISTKGRVEPIVSVTDINGHPLSLKGNQEQDLYRFDNSSVEIDVPASGTYMIQITDPYQADYEFSINYDNPDGAAGWVGSRFTNNSTGTQTFTVTLNTSDAATPLTFDRALQPPQDPEESNLNNQIQLTWTDPTGDANQDVDHYEIYWRPDTQPYYQLLGSTTGMIKTYLTPQPWTDVPNNLYVVKAILKDNSSTVMSDPTFYTSS